MSNAKKEYMFLFQENQNNEKTLDVARDKHYKQCTAENEKEKDG